MVKFVSTMELISLAVLVAAIFQVNGAEIQVSSSTSKVSVLPGDDAKLICKSSSVKFCSFNSPTGNTYVMIDGVSYGRYQAIEGEPCGLSITTVQEEDAGDWKCSITALDAEGNGQVGTNEIALVVLKAPKSVSLNVDGQVTVTPEQKEATVRCTAEGGEPVPSFSWTLDGAPASVKVVDSGEEGEGHFQEVSLIPTKADNGKMLECVANSEAYRDEALESGLNKAGVSLDVQYAPEPQKDDLQFYGLAVGKSTEIKIKFRLNPAPTNMEWVMADGTRVPQGSESNEGKYTASLPIQEDASEPDLHTAMLTINEVAEQNGGTSNKLVVTNAHGEANISFELELGAKPPTGEDVLSEGPGALNDDEAGTGPVIAIVIIILLVIVVIAVAVVARSQGLLCFAARDGVNDPEKGNFTALGKDEEDATPEKENKDILKNDPADSAVLAPATVEVKTSAGDSAPPPPPATTEAEEKKSNGAHSPNK